MHREERRSKLIKALVANEGSRQVHHAHAAHIQRTHHMGHNSIDLRRWVCPEEVRLLRPESRLEVVGVRPDSSEGRQLLLCVVQRLCKKAVGHGADHGDRCLFARYGCRNRISNGGACGDVEVHQLDGSATGPNAVGSERCSQPIQDGVGF
eukprot:gene7394-biopygen4997